MAGNVIDEFLVALGWRVDTSAARKAEQTADRVADTIESAEKRATDASVAGAAKRKIEAEREAGRRTKGAAQHIDEIKRRETAEAKAQAAAKKVTAEAERAHKARAAAEAKAAKESESRSAALVRGAAATVAAIEAAAIGVTAAVTKIASGMEALYYAGERTNSSAASLKAFSYAASQLGSSADGATNSLETLAQNMRSSPGYEGMLKNLGVATRQNGKLRELTDITMDLGDAFAAMPHFKAKAFADALGIDERTLIALKDGTFKKHVLEYRGMLAKAGLDSERAAKDAAGFMNTWRRMWASVDIIVTRIGGAMTEKFGGQIERLTTYLLANSDTIARSVVTIGETILRLATRLVDLVQKFNDADPATKQFVIQVGALVGALLLLNSGPVAALLALGSAIVVLYDDYQKWREGSKDTLVPWDKWAPAIENTLAALKSLWEGFDKVAQAITGQSGIVVAFEALAVVMVARLLTPLGKVVGLLGTLGGITPAPWLLRLLGLGGAAVGLAAVANENGVLDGGAGSRSWPEGVVRFLDPGIADRVYGQTPGARAADAKDGRSLYQRVMPKVLGGKDAPTSSAPGVPSVGTSGAATSAAPGVYRPQYSLSDPDLDQRVVNTIVGEVSTKSADGVDAVINNMLNRVGSKGWGPSANLLEVARAPGQYAGYEPRTTAAQTEFVRSRIRAIAAGGVPDNTNGSNSYRAENYYQRTKDRGPGFWAGRATIGPNVGGNRYAFEPGVANGPYKPYAEPRQAPTEALPEVASSANPASDAADYRAYRYELERNAKAGQVPGEEENDAERYQAWRKDRNLNAVVDKVRSVAIDTAGKVEDTLTAYPRAWMAQADTSMGKVSDRFDAASPWKDGKPFAATPLGISHNNSRSVSNTFHEGDRHITVQGVSDPKEAADHVTKSDTRRRSDLIGNFQNSFA